MRFMAMSLMIAASLAAQNISSGLSGTLHDPAAAVVSGVEVQLVSEDRGFVRRAVTNSDGFFSFPDLTPGTFTLSITAPGFKAYRQTTIELNSGEQRSLGVLRLQIGAISDTVTVTAEAVAVNTATGEKASSLDAKELDVLALRGRDIFDAVSLMPGVVDTSDGRDAPGPTSIGNIFIAGGRNDQKNMTIDGITNLDTGSNGSIHSMPSMDSVAELKVLTSNYAAEYGRNSGGTVTVITKGGNKQFHASGSWFYRHEDLNANDFFSNQAGRSRTPYRYNITSYTFDGPILLPKMNRHRDKLFFHFSQEFQEKRQAYGTKTVTVPTAEERDGNFTHHYNTNGTMIVIQDPLNNKAAFPGNIIPAARITAIGRSILNLFPMPNYTDPNPSRVYQWNYFASEAGGYPRRTETLRVDYQPRSNWQVYARLSNNSDVQHSPYGLWVNGSLNFDITPIVFAQPGRGAVFHSTNTFGTASNELIWGVSQNTLTYGPEDYSKLDRTALGINIPQRNPALNPYNMIPNMTFGTITNYANPSLSDGTPYFNRNTIYSFVDNLSKVWKTHVFKAGLYIERTRKVQFANAATRGTLKFDRDTNNALDANDAYANALLGNYDTYAEATGRPKGDYFFANTEWYLQDTWRVNRRLSLDFGLRFYHDPPQYDRLLQLHSFSPAAYDPATAPVLLRPGFDANRVKVAVDPRTGINYAQGLIGSFAPNFGNPADGMLTGGKNGVPAGMYSIPAVYAAPRFGFAFDPLGTGRMALRGGVGVFYDRLEGNPTMNTLANPPTIFTPTQYYGTIASIQDQVGSGLLAPSGTVYSLAGPGKVTAAYNFSFSVQKQIGKKAVAEVSYVGNLGRHLIWQRNINPVPLGSNFVATHPQNRDITTTNNALPANFLRPYQGYGDIFLYEFAGTSNYHSLQASFSQRFAKGITFGGSYTFSKVLDESDGYSSSVDPFYNPRTWNYGPAGFDRTQVFSGRYTWDLPKVSRNMMLPVRVIANSWKISGITRMVTGAPVTPSYSLVNGIDFTGSGSASTRPVVLNPDADALSRFGPPSFSAPNVPTLGNVGKGVLRGPGVNNWDISLYRDLRLTERLRGQLRFETYNTFNHTQFSAIDGGLKFDAKGAQINPLFLQPTTSARPPRIAQISMRLWF